MSGLSQLGRFAWLASFSSFFGYATPALAQVPAFAPAETPVTDAAPPASPVEPPPAPAPVAPVPAAPSAAPNPATPPAAEVEHDRAPEPAKTDVLHESPAADERDEEDIALTAKPQPEWYGWQTLVSDGASFGSMIASGVLGGGVKQSQQASEMLGTIGLVGYLTGPGIIHFVHRNPGRGFGSFGIRFALPLVGLWGGATVASGCTGRHCEVPGAVAGLLLGLGGAIAIDAAVLAYDDRPLKRSAFSPRFSWSSRHVWLGVGGGL